jgi:Tol biopolymer transport system component
MGAALIGALMVLLRRDPVPELSNPIQVTRSIGAEAYPSWSPEGGRLAYHLNVKGHEMGFDVWVTQVGSGHAVNLTEDHPGNDLFPSWSPDGSQIAFWSDRQGGGYFVMPALGGPARKVSEHRLPWWEATGAEWSFDGSKLACALEGQGGPVRVVSLGSGERREVELPGRNGSRLDLRWSPDGRFFAYVDAGNRTNQVTELRVSRVGDQSAFSITDGRSNVWSPSWSSDGRYLYFVSNRVGSMDLWRQRVKDGEPQGEPERVTAGIGMTSAAFSPDGRRVAYSRGRVVSNVWRVPILKDRPATWADARQITFDDAHIEMLDLPRDGKRLVISSDRAGNPDLWVLPSQGGEMEPIAADPTPDWAPAWSPDGKEIAFYAYRSGNRQIWVQPVTGGVARQLTKGEVENTFPVWSPDGQSLLFTKGQGRGDNEFLVVPAGGGTPRKLAMHPEDKSLPRWSPDGRWLAFDSRRSGATGLWRARAAGEDPRLLLEAEVYSVRWSPDSKWIYYIKVDEGSADTWAIGVDGRMERPMTELRGRRGGPGAIRGALATDGSFPSPGRKTSGTSGSPTSPTVDPPGFRQRFGSTVKPRTMWMGPEASSVGVLTRNRSPSRETAYWRRLSFLEMGAWKSSRGALD